MGSDSQTLQQASKLIGQRDFDGAVELLSPIDDPSPDELFALAEAHFLKATSTLQCSRSARLARLLTTGLGAVQAHSTTSQLASHMGPGQERERRCVPRM